MLWGLLAVALVALYQLGVLAALLVAWRNPVVAPQHTPADVGVGFEELRFPTAHGRSLHGWWISGGDGAARPLVVLVHGWGRNAERMLPYVPMLHPQGFHLLAFDARHHGTSDADGYATMLKFSEDLRAAVDFALTRPGVDPARIAVLGLSIGGAAAIHAAGHDRRIRAVASVGAFADPRDAMIPPRGWAVCLRPALPLAFAFMEWRIEARFSEIAPEAMIRGATARFLLVHGKEDTVVPVGHAYRLRAAAPDHATLWVIPGRGHSDPHLESGFQDRLTTFLQATLATPTGR